MAITLSIFFSLSLYFHWLVALVWWSSDNATMFYLTLSDGFVPLKCDEFKSDRNKFFVKQKKMVSVWVTATTTKVSRKVNPDYDCGCVVAKQKVAFSTCAHSLFPLPLAVINEHEIKATTSEQSLIEWTEKKTDEIIERKKKKHSYNSSLSPNINTQQVL